MTSFITLLCPQDPYYAEAAAIYTTAFTDEERVPFDHLIDWLHPPESGMTGTIGAFVENGQVLAMGSASFFQEERFGYLPYLAVKEGLRGQGVGQKVVGGLLEWIEACAMEQTGRVPRLTFWDVRHPDKTTDEAERTDRLRRIKFYERLGAVTLPIAYTYPPVAEGQPYVRNLLMARTHPPGGPITRQDALDLAQLAVLQLASFQEDSVYWVEALSSIDAAWPE